MDTAELGGGGVGLEMAVLTTGAIAEGSEVGVGADADTEGDGAVIPAPPVEAGD